MFVLTSSLKSLALRGFVCLFCWVFSLFYFSFLALNSKRPQAYGKCVHYEPYWPRETSDLWLVLGSDRDPWQGYEVRIQSVCSTDFLFAAGNNITTASMSLAGSLPEAGRWSCRRLLAPFLHRLQGWTCKRLERNRVQLVPLAHVCSGSIAGPILERVPELGSWHQMTPRSLSPCPLSLQRTFRALRAKRLPDELSPGAPGTGTESGNRARRSCSLFLHNPLHQWHTTHSKSYMFLPSGEKMSVRSAHATLPCY